MRSPEKIIQYAKLLSDTTRVKILLLLLSHKDEVCVMEIAKGIAMSHSATSHQLARLESAGAIRSSRRGQTNCYCIASNKTASAITSILKQF